MECGTWVAVRMSGDWKAAEETGCIESGLVEGEMLGYTVAGPVVEEIYGDRTPGVEMLGCAEAGSVVEESFGDRTPGVEKLGCNEAGSVVEESYGDRTPEVEMLGCAEACLVVEASCEDRMAEAEEKKREEVAVQEKVEDTVEFVRVEEESEI